MQNSLSASGKVNSRRGAVLPLLAICMVILFCSVVLSIDVARMHLVRSELRTATDAAARAGAEALGRLESREAAVDAAINLASRNIVGGVPLTLTPDQVQIGRALVIDGNTTTFQNDVQPFNAVRITGSRQNGSADGSINLFFGSLFGSPQFQPIQSSTACRLDRDIALVLDTSGSMVVGGRMDGLKNAVRIFIEELEQTPHIERVSLITYSTTAEIRVPLTENLNLIRETLQPITPNGATAIGLGLQCGLNSVRNDPLARVFAEKTVIIMTDGEHNTGISPINIVNSAGAVTVHTVTFGNGASQATMRRVAEIGHGIHLHAANNAQLATAFRDIAHQLSVLLVE